MITVCLAARESEAESCDREDGVVRRAARTTDGDCHQGEAERKHAECEEIGRRVWKARQCAAVND